MPDLKKVIKGLEMSYTYSNVDEDNTLVPQQLVLDAFALLKAQEPMLVVNIHKAYNNVLNPNTPWVGKCPKCGKKISGKNLTRFCMYCGKAVKWE